MFGMFGCELFNRRMQNICNCIDAFYSGKTAYCSNLIDNCAARHCVSNELIQHHDSNHSNAFAMRCVRVCGMMTSILVNSIGFKRTFTLRN